MMEHQLCKEKERTCDYLSTALPVHCLAHLLNLCLQDAARQVELLRDAMDVVREIVGLIKLSPKRTIFKWKIVTEWWSKVWYQAPLSYPLDSENRSYGGGDYSVLMETMEEVHCTTWDEYGLKAAGILAALENLRYSLAWSWVIFLMLLKKHLKPYKQRIPQSRKQLQLCDTSFLSATKVWWSLWWILWVVAQAKDLEIGEPKLPIKIL